MSDKFSTDIGYRDDTMEVIIRFLPTDLTEQLVDELASSLKTQLFPQKKIEQSLDEFNYRGKRYVAIPENRHAQHGCAFLNIGAACKDQTRPPCSRMGRDGGIVWKEVTT